MIFLLHVKKGGFPGSGTQIPFSKKSSILVGRLPSSPGLRTLAPNSRYWTEATDWLGLGYLPKPWIPGGGKKVSFHGQR